MAVRRLAKVFGVLEMSASDAVIVVGTEPAGGARPGEDSEADQEVRQQ
jgi:hypothetical protein